VAAQYDDSQPAWYTLKAMADDNTRGKIDEDRFNRSFICASLTPYRERPPHTIWSTGSRMFTISQTEPRLPITL